MPGFIRRWLRAIRLARQLVKLTQSNLPLDIKDILDKLVRGEKVDPSKLAIIFEAFLDMKAEIDEIRPQLELLKDPELIALMEEAFEAAQQYAPPPE